MFKAGISAWAGWTSASPSLARSTTACQASARSAASACLTHYTEPRPLKWPIDQVRQYAASFDLILTNEEALLDLPNAQFALSLAAAGSRRRHD